MFAWIKGLASGLVCDATARRRGSASSLAGLIAVALLHGCAGNGGSGKSNPPEPSATASLAAGVTVLSGDAQAAITESASTSVSFNAIPAEVAALRPDDIFIAGNVARKVVAVTVSGGSTIVQTAEPSFGEVFRTLQIDATLDLSSKYLVDDTANAMALRVRPQSISIDAGATATGYAVQLGGDVLTGRIDFEQPRVEVRLNYGLLDEYRYAYARFVTSASSGLKLSLLDVSGTVGPLQLRLLTWRVPVVLSFGTVSVDVAVYLVVQADGSAQLVAGISQKASIDVSMTTTLAPLTTTIRDDSMTPEVSLQEPEFNGEVTARLAIEPSYDIQILQYPLAGMKNGLGVEAAASVIVNLNQQCAHLKADAYIAGDAYIMLPNLALDADFTWEALTSGVDLSMLRHDKQLFRQNFTVYETNAGECPAPNLPPVARAGADATVEAGTTVQLNGATSSDADGTIVTYAWTQLDGVPVDLAGANSAVASFVAPFAGASLAFRLSVVDDDGAAAADDVIIAVLPPAGMPPGPPGGVTVEPGNAAATLRWNTVAGAASYNVYRAQAAGITPQNYTSIAGGLRVHDAVSPLLVDGLVNGTTYYFIVTAVNSLGESLASQEVSTTPAAPDVSLGGAMHRTIAAGTNRICVIVGTGTVKCWYATIPNDVPVAIDGITDAVQLSAGSDSFCALLADGTIRCWGGNTNGQLGNGTQTSSVTPVTVSGVSGAVVVAVNLTHGCAVLSGGAVKCWGNNTYGQLGTGSTGANQLTAVDLVGVSDATDLSVGYGYTCVVASQGKVKCVGSSQYGTLGNGTAGFASTVLVEASGIQGAAGVFANPAHTCAVLASGTGYCWGANGNGELGSGTFGNKLLPTQIAGLSGIAALGTEGSHSCAIAGSGNVWCWGYNALGEVGQGASQGTISYAPVQVAAIDAAIAIAGGNAFTCAVRSVGTVACWGRTTSGNTSSPVLVPGIADAR